MSNLVKKVSSVILGVAVVMSSVSSIAGVSADNAALDAANKLAGLGIIVDQSSNPSDYRLGDTISRRELAKITMNLAGATVSDTCEGKFKDLPASDWGCKYAEAGLKAGFFAANVNFRPQDKVSKGEALKMIMKAKGIEATPGLEPWQARYVSAAVEAGITDAFTDYNTAVVRSDIFTWASNASDVNVTDPFCEILGTCPTDGTGTTNTGTTNTGVTNTGVTVSGDLNVSLNPGSLVNGTQIPKAGIVKFAKVDFSAASSDISLTSVELVKAGLANIPTGTRVWFEKNGIRVSGKTSFTSENNAIISFAPAYVVKAGTTETIDLYIELNGASSNDIFQFASRTIESSAAKTTGGFTTASLQSINYNVATATVEVNGVGTSQNASTDAIELAKFKISNTDANPDTRDLNLKSILLYQQGTANLTNLSNVKVERNGVVVSSGVTMDGKKLNISLNDTIKDGSTGIYVLKAVINNVELTNDTYQFYVKNTSDVSIDEVSTSFRAIITSTVPVTFGLYSVTGGDVKFERDTTVALSSTVAPGTSDVVLMKGTITAKTAVNLENVKLDYNTISGLNLGAVAQMNTVYLKIGGSTFTWTPANGQAEFLGSATVNGTVPVLLYTKLKDGANGNIKFGDLKLGSFTTKEYVVNQNVVTSAIGSISAVQVTVGASTLNVTRTDGLGNTTMAAGSKDKTVYSARFSSTQGNTIALSNLVANINASGLYLNNVDLDLYVNGVKVNSKNVNGNSVAFNNFNANVTTSQAVDVTIKANFQDVYSAGTFQISSLGYDAVDNITSITVTKPVVAGVTFTLANPTGTLAVTSSDNSVNRSLLLSPSTNVRLTSFKVTATNDNIKLSDLVLTGSNLNSISNIRLVDSSNNTLGYASSVTNTGASFDNLDTLSPSITINNSAVYYIVADVNDTTNVNGVVVNVVAAGSFIRGSNGNVVAMLGSDVAGASHDVAQNTFKITQVTPTNNDINSHALDFKINAYGQTLVGFSSANIEAELGAYSTAGYTGAVVSIYKDNQLVGTGTANMVGTKLTSTVNMTAYNTVDKDTNTTYEIRVEGLTLNASTNKAFTVRLTGLTSTSGLNANSYIKNTETLPLISTK